VAFEPENLVSLSGTTLENIEAALGDVKTVAPEVWKHVEQTITDEVRRIETTMTMMVSDIHTGYMQKAASIEAELSKAKTKLDQHLTAWVVLGFAVAAAVAGYLVS